MNFTNPISKNEFQRLVRKALVMPVMLFLVVSFLFFWQLFSLRQATEMVARADGVISQSNIVLKLLLDAQTASRGYALTKDEIYLEPYTDAIKVWDFETQKLVNLTLDNPSQSKVIRKTLDDSNLWLSFVHRSIRDRLDGAKIEDLHQRRKESYKLFKNIRKGFDKLIITEERIRNQRSLEVLYISRLTLSVGIFAGICMGLMAYFYSRGLLYKISDIYAKNIHDLEESDLRYKLASNATKDAIWELNLLTKEVIRTDAMTSVFGYERSQVENEFEWWQKRTHPEDKDRIVSSLYEVIVHNESTWTGDYRFLRADGTYAYVRDRAVIYYKDGIAIKVIGAMKDMTQEVLEIQKRQEAEKVRDIFFDLPNLLLVMASKEGIFLRLNRAWSEILGYPMDEIQGKHYMNFVHPDDKDRTTKIDEKINNGQRILSFKNRYICKDGTIKWFHWNSIPIGDTIYSFVSDITDLQEALEARDTFLSIASHELKTPLTSLQLQIQMAKRSLDKEHQSKILGLFDHSELSLKRITRLVDDMLDISRISGGKLTLNAEYFDLKDLVKDLTERMGYQFESAQMKIYFDEMETAFGNWDKFKIEQVVSNIFSNAIKYAEKSEFRISVKVRDDFAIASFKDFGPGISLEDQQRVFQQFERASQHVSGMGLGLFISKEIVEQHLGSLTVRSSLGEGSEFVMVLPIS